MSIIGIKRQVGDCVEKQKFWVGLWQNVHHLHKIKVASRNRLRQQANCQFNGSAGEQLPVAAGRRLCVDAAKLEFHLNRLWNTLYTVCRLLLLCLHGCNNPHTGRFSCFCPQVFGYTADKITAWVPCYLITYWAACGFSSINKGFSITFLTICHCNPTHDAVRRVHLWKGITV